MPSFMPSGLHSPLFRRLTDSLYVEAMLLADEARAYFDEIGRSERNGLDAMRRVRFSCESLNVTTRLMHTIAWLLTQRAVQHGELAPDEALHPSRRLGEAPESDAVAIAHMPDATRILIEASIDLYRRAAFLDEAQVRMEPVESPARLMIARLATAF